MKSIKTTNVSLILSILAVFGLISCASSPSNTQIDGKDYITEGWVDDDTFQVKALGAPSPKAKGFVKRRTQSKEAALLSAQKRVVELLVGAKITGASGSQDGESTGIIVTKEFEGVVKGGAIINTSYDEADNCEITYRVSFLRAKRNGFFRGKEI